jgi:hypothetical protein
MSWRARHGQWVAFYLKDDPYNEKLIFLAKQGCARTRSGKLLGIYHRAKRHDDVVLIPPDAPEQVQGGWLDERVMLVDKHMGANIPMTQNGRYYEGCYFYRDVVEDLEPVLDRADLPPGRYVPPGFQFRP